MTQANGIESNRPTIIGILTRLWERFGDGEDRRKATPEESTRFAWVKDCYSGSGEHGGIEQTVRRRNGVLYIEGEQWNRAVAWSGFGDARSGIGEWGPAICTIFDRHADPKAKQRLETFIASRPVGEFVAYLDSVDVNWRDEPMPAKVGEGKPKYDRERRKLIYNEQVVKRFTQKAENQEPVLLAFEEEGWPSRIDDPLPGGRCIDRKHRLSLTMQGLNRNQEVLRFRTDGTGEGILWEPHSERR